MREGKKIVFAALAVVFILILPAAYVNSEEASLPDAAQKCLTCHGKRGTVFRFENNDSIEAYIDAEKVRSSVHHSLRCSDCHADFSSDDHPVRKFRDRRQYVLRSSLTCRRCHPDEQIKVKPIHSSLLKGRGEGIVPVCTDCHGSHDIMPVRGGRLFESERNYCMSCHSHALKLYFRDGKTTELKMDASSLQASVHDKLRCSDCHYGFSSEEHPQRNFRTRRDYAIASSEGCRRCHFDKYTKTMESIHFTILSGGNLSAPVCTDCHGSHSVTRGEKEKGNIIKRCQKCHSEIYSIYAKSVHGKALFDERIQDVPICIDCHTAHNITDPRTSDYRERVPDICGNCHANKEIMSKYGLSTDVVMTYLSDFHGVTLRFYKKQEGTPYRSTRQMAVCTDCHGTHDISGIVGTDVKTIKANLVKRCQKCHENATGNFPDAWISHYEPDLRKASMVYIVSLIYKILTPLMIAGLVLQILLHIWRYAVNR